MAKIQEALAHYQAERFDAALKLAKAALMQTRAQERAPVLLLLSNIHLKLGNKRAAADSFVAAARMMPEKRAAFFKFAVGLYRDENDYGAIADIAAEAAAALPDPDFLFELASACKEAGRLIEVKEFITGLDFSQSPHFMMLNAFGAALGEAGKFSTFLEDACQKKPDDGILLSLRFAVAASICDFPSVKALDRLVADPTTPLAMTLLENELAYRRLLRNSDEAHQTLPSYDERALQLAGGAVPAQRRAFSPPGTKIKIGYLSNDFHQHVTMRLFEEVMALHDRDRFEIVIFCYTDEDRRDYQRAWPEILRQSVVQVGSLSDQQAADAIDAAGVDILVDLKGYTQGARLGIVRRCRVPVKATYLGFPGPVRGADLDYAITDRIVTPESSRPYYEEKFCRLPESYQSNGSKNRARPQPLSRSELGLPENKIILGSFNTPTKISPEVLRLWAAILKRIPDAVLNLLCSDATARQNIAAALAEEGVDPAQLLFFAGEPYLRFLARIAAVDIALDTFPYNGHTTTSDILWMGTPVVAMKGTHFAGRVSESLLAAIGAPELVATDADGYCDLAVRLASDAAMRETVRNRLASNRRLWPLFDTERFTRHLELGYEAMATRARQGLAPDHLDIEALRARTDSLSI
ncbi:hypothetical protein [Rhizobium sp. L1K21]|uniref:O-linked N-acetylglucosamine transferase, SPINDLY family protein n=1 Tax=Rhizobium sp. L1K21 TaxID=2954933 RepID=UPI00209317E6|nr:hypothetical protein [Rhizobium sp. L1K21]MCO6186675.1 hypothetical protein [Rhizobium sp. L1K21]